MSVEREAITALKWTGIARFAGQAVSWLITLAVVRLLVPEDYGLMAIATVIIAISTSVAELGMGASLVQASTLQRDELRKVAGLAIALNVTFALLVALAAPLAAAIFGDARLTAVIRVCAIQFVLNALSAVPQALAYRQMKFKRLAWIELISGLAANAATLALAIAGSGVWALVSGLLVGAGLRTALLLTGGDWVRPAFGLQGIRGHLRFGGALTVSRLGWQTISQADVLIAGRLLPPAAVGAYSVAFQLATLPMQKIMSIVNQVAFPTVARLQDDLPRLRARLLDASRLLTFVSVPIAWGISAVAPEFVGLAFGAKWVAVVLPLQLVSLIVPLRMLNAMLVTAAAAMGRVSADLQNTLVSACVLLPGFVVGVLWGIDGLAVAWLLAIPLIFVLNFPRIGRTIGLTVGELARAVWAPVTAGVAMYVTVTASRLALTHSGDLSRLVVLVGVGALTYLTLVAFLDRRVWRDVKRTASALKG